MEYLKNKLNGDICNIIYNYLDQSEQNLNKLYNKIKYIQDPYSDISLSILDLICRAIQLGYNGLSIPNTSKPYINYISRYIKKNNIDYITIITMKDSTIFHLKAKNIKLLIFHV